MDEGARLAIGLLVAVFGFPCLIGGALGVFWIGVQMHWWR